MSKKNRRQSKRRKVNGTVSKRTPCRKLIDMSRLKDFVECNFPPGEPIREVIICEKDIISAEEFLAKLPIWLKLMDLYCKRRKEVYKPTYCD